MEWSIRCDLIWFAGSKVEAVLLYGTYYSTSVYHYQLLDLGLLFREQKLATTATEGFRLSPLVIRYKGSFGSTDII